MTYRTIMVQLLGDDGLDVRLRAAAGLAHRFDAALMGVHVLPPPVLPISAGDAAAYAGPEIIEAQRETSLATARRLERSFEEACAAPEIAAGFKLEDGDPATCYAALARTADLALVPQLKQSGIDALIPELSEQLLIDSGTPGLMLPVGASTTIGRKIVVGWSGSREAARAVRDARPFLREADEIRVVTIGDRREARFDEAVASMRRHGLQPVERVISDPKLDAGAGLLEEADAWGADLLVMGAYSHARFREVIFGGATRHIMDHATIPVLFSA